MTARRTAPLAAIIAALWGGFVVVYHDSWVLPAYLVLAAGLVVLSAIDLVHLILPNRIVYPLFVAVLILLALAAIGDDDSDAFGRAVLAALVVTVAFGALYVVARGSLGLGDVKLAAVLGLSLGWLSWGTVVIGILFGFVIGAVVGLVLVAAGRIGRRDHLPFGPFLAAGTLLTLLLQLPR